MKSNLIKIKNTLKLFCSILLILPFIGKSQTGEDNHRKYWYYRSRLVNDFMKVGLGQGEITIKKVVVQ